VPNNLGNNNFFGSPPRANAKRVSLTKTEKCPLWVRSGHFAESLRCPLYPRNGATDVRFGSKPDIAAHSCDVRFSNRPVGVKRFQTHHDCGVDVTCGLALLFGLGAKALPSWDSRTRWDNLYRGLAVVGGRSSRHTNSPHPPSHEGHHTTAYWSSSFLLSHWILSPLMLLQLLWSI
jgi:hypothetical protein